MTNDDWEDYAEPLPSTLDVEAGLLVSDYFRRADEEYES